MYGVYIYSHVTHLLVIDCRASSSVYTQWLVMCAMSFVRQSVDYVYIVMLHTHWHMTWHTWRDIECTHSMMHGMSHTRWHVTQMTCHTLNDSLHTQWCTSCHTLKDLPHTQQFTSCHTLNDVTRSTMHVMLHTHWLSHKWHGTHSMPRHTLNDSSHELNEFIQSYCCSLAPRCRHRGHHYGHVEISEIPKQGYEDHRRRAQGVPCHVR